MQKVIRVRLSPQGAQGAKSTGAKVMLRQKVQQCNSKGNHGRNAQGTSPQGEQAQGAKA